MQKVSYMGDGSTTEFTFNIPYFTNTNIVVTKNGVTATGYIIVGTSAGLDADIPYTGGKVVFETAPNTTDCITISRNLPLSRIADYQPTAKIEPTTLNQDLNYLMEIFKDRKEEINELREQYDKITDIEALNTIVARITACHEEITEISAEIDALGDISTLQQTVSDLVTTTGNHTTSIGTLDTRTSGLSDYVIESQSPSADNNYSWYRKYKSGWLEQGGIATVNYATADAAQEFICTFPKPFSNTNYTECVNCVGGMSTTRIIGAENIYTNRFTGFVKQGGTGTLKVHWCAYGF